jgi:hypothetical protein
VRKRLAIFGRCITVARRIVYAKVEILGNLWLSTVAIRISFRLLMSVLQTDCRRRGTEIVQRHLKF